LGIVLIADTLVVTVNVADTPETVNVVEVDVLPDEDEVNLNSNLISVLKPNHNLMD
jgi:hypothetical protein